MIFAQLVTAGKLHTGDKSRVIRRDQSLQFDAALNRIMIGKGKQRDSRRFHIFQ